MVVMAVVVIGRVAVAVGGGERGGGGWGGGGGGGTGAGAAGAGAVLVVVVVALVAAVFIHSRRTPKYDASEGRRQRSFVSGSSRLHRIIEVEVVVAVE